MESGRCTQKNRDLQVCIRLALIVLCFLFSISVTACGRRADPVLIPSYPDTVADESIGSGPKTAGPDETLADDKDGPGEKYEAAGPDAPQSLTGIYTGKSIVLTWKEVVGQNVRSYRVYRSDGGDFILAGETVTPAFTDRSIEQDRKYSYRVTASGQTESLPSDEIIIVTGSEQP